MKVKVWRLASERFPEIPSAGEYGWIVRKKSIEPLWTDGEVLPKTLIDLIRTGGGEESESEEDDCCDSEGLEEFEMEDI